MVTHPLPPPRPLPGAVLASERLQIAWTQQKSAPGLS
jgi:hypothetical protein